LSHALFHRADSRSSNLSGEFVMRLILLILVIILVVGALPAWPYSAGWGYYPSGGLGLVLVVLLILALLGFV
jgi:hypothetical protein